MAASAALRVQLLGPVRAWRGDDEIELGSARRQAVFAMLALRANESVSLAELVDGIWGEQPPARAVGILHTYIYDLRRALDPTRDRQAVLTTVESSYLLRLAPENRDEHRFHELHETARRHWGRGDLAAALHAVRAALTLWHGTALQGLAGPFAELHRARLGELRITVAEHHGALLLARGDQSGAVRQLSEVVAAFPFRETARGLLMVALNQDGRRDEALDLYRETERILLDAQGIEPGQLLLRLRQRIADGEPVSVDDIGLGMAEPVPVTAIAGPLARLGRARPEPPGILVGRDDELGWLRSQLVRLSAGHGGCVWIEGEPGIGKTALLAAALADFADGSRVVWTSADGLIDERRDEAPAGSGSVAVDRALAVVEQLCVERPLVFVVDDLERLDDAGTAVWHRLSRLTRRLPLLLLGACQAGSTIERKRVRNTVGAVGGRVLNIGPLSRADLVRLAEQTLGVACGPVLRDVLRVVAGNPAHAHQLLDAVRGFDTLPTATSEAELSPAWRHELAAAQRRRAWARFDVLTPRAQDVLRSAALLGTTIDVADLAAVLHSSADDLLDAVQEVTTARLMVDSGSGLAFSDQRLRQALLDDRPPDGRAAAHRAAAAALAGAGAAVERIAGQLRATPFDAWSVRWLLDNVEALATRDPGTAVELVERAVAGSLLSEREREALAVRGVRLAYRLGKRPERAARSVLETTGDPEHAGEMRWILAQLDDDAGATEKAIADLLAAEADPTVPDAWRARYHALRARLERVGGGDLDALGRTASAAFEQATKAADAAAIGSALSSMWFVATARRDNAAALGYVDKALGVVGTAPELLHLRLELLSGRADTLQNLDRLDEASETLAGMRAIAERMQTSAAVPYVSLAVHHYWSGAWDDALAALDQLGADGETDRAVDLPVRAPLVRHGVAAVIAARRGDAANLWAHLRAADACPLITMSDQDYSGFVVVARAVEAGGRAGPRAELSAMDPLLDLGYGRFIPRYQWLPRIMRLALDTGDHTRVRAAARVSEKESERETPPTRAYATARWCRALRERDAEALLDVGRYFGDVGRLVQRAEVLVDAAIVLAELGKTDPARRTLREALSVLAAFGATADIGRARDRLRELGVDETDQPEFAPMVTGWHELSDIERRIAELVAAGLSNPEIGAELTLSRLAVQAQLSHVMRKLAAASRDDLAKKIADALGDRPARP